MDPPSSSSSSSSGDSSRPRKESVDDTTYEENAEQGLLLTSKKSVSQLKQRDPQTLTEQEKAILSMDYAERSRKSRRHRR